MGAKCYWTEHPLMKFFQYKRLEAANRGPLKSSYWLAAETGMRVGELCGLRIEDIDLERCLVNACYANLNLIVFSKVYSAMKRFSEKAHSSSIHCAWHRKPVAVAMHNNSWQVYL